ncbi:MAG TPA: DUF4149 domain-containing protein [Candidatus Angelobacter sp.]|jgi:uncharacterized membrane protein
MILALIVWIGGIIFFAFVLAPTLFHVLPTTKLAGDVVNATLSKLHWMGLVSGVVFLSASLLLNWQKDGQLRTLTIAHIFVVLMLALTAISQFGITPRMRATRARMDSLVAHPAWDDTVRSEFALEHQLSTWTEGAILFLGLGVAVLTTRRFGSNS